MKEKILFFILIYIYFLKISAEQRNNSELTLDQIIEKYENLEYEDVIEKGFLLGKNRNFPIEDRLKALELSLVSALILNQKGKAEEILNYILQIDPGYIFPEDEYSPRIVRNYNRIKDEIILPEALFLNKEILKSESLKGKLKIYIPNKESLPDGTVAVILHYKKEKEKEWHDLPMEFKGEEVSTTITELPKEKKLKFKVYVELRAFSGVILALIGSDESPIEVLYNPPKPVIVKPLKRVEKKKEVKKLEWHKAWWFWTAVGVLIAGGIATGSYFLYEQLTREIPTDFSSPIKPPER